MSEPLQFEGHQPSDPVSLVVRRRIRPGQEAAYEALLAEANALLARLPGHRGTGVIRPAPGEQEYTLLARFDTLTSAAAWELSPERAAWLERIAPLVDEHVSFEKQPGLDFWFTPPAAATLRQPPRWKMALLTLAALYPVSVSTSWLFGEALKPWLGHYPMPIRAIPQMIVVVLLMTYLVMPAVTRWATPWLRGK
ncbi:antibiotic biosynthesis monooxygenase [Deinococcus arenae]|uniref:Antibiotic biosynthesis monooxygenase n=1 Tax=Deinococcus arenae TaxID=1452751 RepID=A0A8H9GUA4_9DEIO|nr:antibiotic biosynthesis monooxygenase [Deinococcus arenae]AWT36540.1 antibiotic biosynthesis monooxygenase [Deinococcus actinosclerus]GGM42842.1 antibiotic biosynthesis monooxygenase [Deinococcus arenae]